jgi:hypothetical protein
VARNAKAVPSVPVSPALRALSSRRLVGQ